MLIFSITTTTKIVSLSLHDGTKIIGEIRVEVAKTHSTGIIDQIDKLFEWTGKKLSDIDNVVVSTGPGSFTGVRIAISVVKGLFYGRNVNIYEVNELDALAYQIYYFAQSTSGEECSGMKIYSMIDSGKEKIYYSVYTAESFGYLKKDKDDRVSKLDNVIESISLEENEKIYITGDGAFNYKEKITENLKDKVQFSEDKNMKINSSTFAQMLLHGKLHKTDIFNLKPDYLEKSQAERDKKERGNNGS